MTIVGLGEALFELDGDAEALPDGLPLPEPPASAGAVASGLNGFLPTGAVYAAGSATGAGADSDAVGDAAARTPCDATTPVLVALPEPPAIKRKYTAAARATTRTPPTASMRLRLRASEDGSPDGCSVESVIRLS
jgi:hypothetical protein